jgi:hypothetical protein
LFSGATSFWSNVFGPLFLFSLILSVEPLDPAEATALDDIRNAMPGLQSMWTGNASDACSLGWTGLNCAGGHVTQMCVQFKWDIDLALWYSELTHF